VRGVESVVDVAEDFCPVVLACRDEMEATHRLPARVAAELASAGLMRMGVAASLGGPEIHPVQMLDVIDRLAVVNPSAAWCVMISCTTTLASGWMEHSSAAEVFGDPVGVWAGTVAPTATATPTDAGLMLEGRWSFGSGCQNATWMGGGALQPDGQHVLCFVPAADFEIIENWDVMGLRGTGSHDWAVAGADVPAQRWANVFSARPVANAPLYRMGLFGPLAAGIAMVGVGAATASVAALVELAGAKTPTFQSRPLAQRPTVQAEVSRAATSLDAARGLLRAAVDASFAQAARGDTPTVSHRAAIRRAATHAAETSANVAAAMFRLAGGTAIRNDAPFARLLCDTQTVTQHLMVGPATWEVTGQQLLGLPADRPDL
jgi:alkylation response protein AidB-like acyl-CoA dehydrogenase